MKRKSVCAFLFLIFLSQVEKASASENVSGVKVADLQSDVKRLNGYLRGYEAYVCQRLNQSNLDHLYQKDPIHLFYFSHERIFFPKSDRFSEHYFKQASLLLERYFSAKSIKSFSATMFLKVKMLALFLAIKFSYDDLSGDITKYTVLFDEAFPGVFSPRQWKEAESDFLKILSSENWVAY